MGGSSGGATAGGAGGASGTAGTAGGNGAGASAGGGSSGSAGSGGGSSGAAGTGGIDGGAGSAGAPDAGGGAAGSSAGGSAGTSGSDAGVTTWGTKCGAGNAPTVSGQVFAPNGTDPAFKSLAYIPKVVQPIAPGVACDACTTGYDPNYVAVITGIDGRFSLDLTSVPTNIQLQLVVRKGRFRKVTDITPSCGTDLAVPKSATTLPGTASAGDIPSIAVGTGNQDHLEKVLDELGISDYDCYDGTAKQYKNCPSKQDTGQRVLDLLKNKSKLDTYNLLFLSCAPNIFSSYSAADRATIVKNLGDWTAAGGRLIATDMSYDYISQTWPNAITWAGPAGVPWQIGTTSGNGANVGRAPTGSSYYTGVITDQNIVDWLKLPEIGVSSAPNVQIEGWLNPWALQMSVNAGTTAVVHGSVDYIYPNPPAKTVDAPLTSEFVVNSCGRVIFSSYHTYTNSTTLLPQERVLEYLMLDEASCLAFNPSGG